MNKMHRLGVMGPVDLLALGTFPGGMSWFECFCGSYLTPGWWLDKVRVSLAATPRGGLYLSPSLQNRKSTRDLLMVLFHSFRALVLVSTTAT